MRGVRNIAAMLLLLATVAMGLAASRAQAADVKTFGVLPFTVNGEAKYQYLSKGVQDMLLSRLYWKDHVVPADKAAMAKTSVPASSGEAESVRSSLGVDYLVWGSVTVMGKQASVDMTALGADGQTWTKSEQTELSRLIPALDGLAKTVNADMFGRQAPAPVAPAASQEQKERVPKMNPGLVYNEAKANQEFYLNPQFRYAGNSEDGTRLQSQRLNLVGRGMVAGDMDGDGKTEIIILTESSVNAYRFDDQGKFRPLAVYNPPKRLDCMYINSLDLDRDRIPEIVVSAKEEQDNAAKSFVLNLRGGKFTVVDEDIEYFLGLYNPPPTFMPVLVGQRKGQINLFDPAVYQMYMKNRKIVVGQRQYTPEKGNVFNTTFYPYKDTYKIVQVDDSDRIKIFTPDGHQQFRSDTLYSGSNVGIEYYNTMAGLGRSEGDMADYYYLPLRTLAVDLEDNRQFELLTNHPVSVAAQTFGRYRSFPQGEVHALTWDGVGMNLLWKTRRLKGAVQDIAVADINNDGVKDLCVCVNTHPGASGLGNRKTIILAYPLATDKTSNVPVDRAFTEESSD